MKYYFSGTITSKQVPSNVSFLNLLDNPVIENSAFNEDSFLKVSILISAYHGVTSTYNFTYRVACTVLLRKIRCIENLRLIIIELQQLFSDHLNLLLMHSHN